MSKDKEQRRLNRKEKRTLGAQARAHEGHFLKIYFDTAEMKQQVIDFAGMMKITPGEFMRSAVLRTMIEMTKRAQEAKNVYEKEMGIQDEDGNDTPKPVAGPDKAEVTEERDEFDNPGVEFVLDDSE